MAADAQRQYEARRAAWQCWAESASRRREVASLACTACRWTEFERDRREPIVFATVPWPPDFSESCLLVTVREPRCGCSTVRWRFGSIREAAGNDAVAYASGHDGDGTASARPREALKTEMLRWHPDKFWQRFGARLAVEDRERIMQHVKLVSQQINAVWCEQNGGPAP